MPGRGPAPKAVRRTRSKPIRGEWVTTPGIGWQHGPIPDPPPGLSAASVAAWDTWMRAWFAAHWIPGDLPALRVLVLIFDAVVGGDAPRLGELRQWMDGYGITPKGQQDRRWKAPVATPVVPLPEPASLSVYSHLRVQKDPA